MTTEEWPQSRLAQNPGRAPFASTPQDHSLDHGSAAATASRRRESEKKANKKHARPIIMAGCVKKTANNALARESPKLEDKFRNYYLVYTQQLRINPLKWPAMG